MDVNNLKKHMKTERKKSDLDVFFSFTSLAVAKGSQIKQDLQCHTMPFIGWLCCSYNSSPEK